MRRSSLPDEITLPTGETLKPVIGGHLEQIPFLTTVDVTKNGWLADLPITTNEQKEIINEAKRRKLKYRRVFVISRNLRNSLDLRNQPYRPTAWVFVQIPEPTPPLYSMPADAVLFPQEGDE
jgi:hypothetical protein